MEKKVTIDNPVAVGGLTIIPVAQVLLNQWHTDNGASFFGVKQPVAILVISRSATMAFKVTGEEVSIAQLVREFPDIEEILQ